MSVMLTFSKNVVLLLCLIHSATSLISLQSLDIFDIGRYLRIGRNLLIGDPRYTRVLNMPFDPYQSDKLKSSFQRTYGYRGENLVNALGAGYSIADLKKLGAV